MIDLKGVSGLPLKYDEKKNVLIFGNGLQQVVPDVRTHKQMLPLLMDKEADAPDDFYLMYRDVHLDKDEDLIRKNNVRYDITIIPPAVIGKEHVKTFGHFHPIIPGKDIRYTEVYGVLYGNAHYLLQKGDGKKVEDFIVVKASAGDKVAILPDYGHATVNPSSKPLIMFNWVEANFKSEYGPVKDCGGFAYYDTKDGFVKNKKYIQIPEIRFLRPKFVEEFALSAKPMYTEGVKNIEKLDYLKNPDKYPEEFKRALL